MPTDAEMVLILNTIIDKLFLIPMQLLIIFITH